MQELREDGLLYPASPEILRMRMSRVHASYTYDVYEATPAAYAPAASRQAYIRRYARPGQQPRKNSGADFWRQAGA